MKDFDCDLLISCGGVLFAEAQVKPGTSVAVFLDLEAGIAEEEAVWAALPGLDLYIARLSAEKGTPGWAAAVAEEAEYAYFWFFGTEEGYQVHLLHKEEVSAA